MKRHAISTAFLAASAMLAGCGEKDPREKSTAPFDDQASSQQARLEGMTQNTDKAPLLPFGFTPYPGAKVTDFKTSTAGKTKTILLTMEANTAPEKIVNFYSQQAEDAGIKIEYNKFTGNGIITGGTLGDLAEFTLTASKDALSDEEVRQRAAAMEDNKFNARNGAPIDEQPTIPSATSAYLTTAQLMVSQRQ